MHRGVALRELKSDGSVGLIRWMRNNCVVGARRPIPHQQSERHHPRHHNLYRPTQQPRNHERTCTSAGSSMYRIFRPCFSMNALRSTKERRMPCNARTQCGFGAKENVDISLLGRPAGTTSSQSRLRNACVRLWPAQPTARLVHVGVCERPSYTASRNDQLFVKALQQQIQAQTS